MSFLRVLILLLTWLPSRGDADTAFRERIALAVVSVADDLTEQNLLARIAGPESNYRPDVADCRVKGDHGNALGLWQVHARTPAEAAALCGSLEGSARVALDRIRESRKACAHLEPRDQLSGYTIGRCVANEPKSRLRWVP